MDRKTCEYIVTNDGSIEAAIIISDSGLPVAWHTKKESSIDEVASISAGLLGIARELHLFDTTSNASMIFETAFGALVLCLTEGYSLLTINRLLKNVFNDMPQFHR